MTRHLWPLLRVQLLMAWRGMRGNLAGKSKWGVIILPLMGLSFVPLLMTITGLYVGLYAGGKLLGHGEVVLTVALTAGQLACLTFGIFYVASAFYYSKDLNLLLPLPLRPGEIVLSKFISILLGEYVTLLPLVAPAFVVYGVMANVSWNYWPFALIIFLLLPVLPLVLGSLFTIMLMRISNLRRNRDVWRVFGALVGICLAFLFSMVNRVGSRGGMFAPSGDQMKQVIEQQQALVTAVGKYFPTSLWATDALREGAPALGAGSFLLFAGTALVAMAAMFLVAEKLFFGGAIGAEESRSSGRVLTNDQLARETGITRSPLRALIQREVKLLNRNPSFLMAALTPVVLLPMFMVVPMLQEKGMAAKLSQLPAVAGSPLVPAIALGVLLFLNSMSSLAATGISREGRHFWISRSLPVAPHIQVQAKLIHTLLFALLNICVVLGAMAYLKVLTPVNLIYVLVGGLTASVATSYAGLYVDLMRPSLKWTEPQQAMKGNYNVLFGILFIWVTLAVVGGLTALMYFVARPLLMPALLLLFLAEAAVLHPLTARFADKRYGDIED